MLNIKSHSHPYQVLELPNIPAAFARITQSSTPFFLVDRRVAEIYREQFAPHIPADHVFLIDATEEAKSYEQLVPVFCWLLNAKCQRSSHIVVIGGGVLQDIGCFIASVLLRGIRWTLIPTTLLAQCDSCIGSKSSLNIANFKNQLGTFYPPHEVLLVFDFLNTLTEEEIHSGLGEAIKLHLIEGATAVNRLRDALTKNPILPAILRDVVWDSLQIKKRFIEEDEFDRGIRRILNYGHTFAHAFESATHYAIPHGIAVTLGVAGATYFSEQLQLIGPGAYNELRQWLPPFWGHYSGTLKTTDLATILTAMSRDKKNQGDKITFILTRGAGKMELLGLPTSKIPQLLQDFLVAL
jgi:3-dehydroquinate synthase